MPSSSACVPTNRRRMCTGNNPSAAPGLGRLRAAEHAEHVDAIVLANLANFSLLDLAAWTYGKLGRKEGLVFKSVLAKEFETRAG